MMRFIIKKEVSRKESRSKYTQVNNVNKNFKGWDGKGITRVNILVNVIKIQRECDESKGTEVEIKSRYAKIAGKFDENINNNSNNTDTYDSNNDNLKVYDGFAGRF